MADMTQAEIDEIRNGMDRGPVSPLMVPRQYHYFGGGGPFPPMDTFGFTDSLDDAMQFVRDALDVCRKNAATFEIAREKASPAIAEQMKEWRWTTGIVDSSSGSTAEFTEVVTFTPDGPHGDLDLAARIEALPPTPNA